MNDNLLIRKGDNIINRMTSISGNVDLDKITPSIWVAQITHIQRILTKPLYDKILTDFTSNALTGAYLTIYDEHITNMLVMFTTADFILKNAITINNGGNFKHTADNGQIVDYKENDRLSKYYLDMGVSFELVFYEHMKTVSIPEYKKCDGGGDNSFQFNWVI